MTTQNPTVERVKKALADKGLQCARIKEFSLMGCGKPEPGYAILLGGVIKGFEKKYSEIRRKIPSSYRLKKSYPDFSNWNFPQYYDFYPISEEKRDIMAKRVIVKEAINSLETKIEEQSELVAGIDPIDSYYKIRVEDTPIGIFIGDPNINSTNF